MPLWVDAELSLFDLERGEVVRRLPLGDAGTNQLEVEFSPAGRWLTVTVAGRSLVFDTRTGQVPAASADWPDRLSDSEALGLRRRDDAVEVVTLEDGAARRFPDDVGTLLLDGGRLQPVER